jgi:hypothetical protein
MISNFILKEKKHLDFLCEGDILKRKRDGHFCFIRNIYKSFSNISESYVGKYIFVFNGFIAGEDLMENMFEMENDSWDKSNKFDKEFMLYKKSMSTKLLINGGK